MGARMVGKLGYRSFARVGKFGCWEGGQMGGSEVSKSAIWEKGEL